VRTALPGVVVGAPCHAVRLQKPQPAPGGAVANLHEDGRIRSSEHYLATRVCRGRSEELVTPSRGPLLLGLGALPFHLCELLLVLLLAKGLDDLAVREVTGQVFEDVLDAQQWREDFGVGLRW
jgi:hypothetical protein